MLTGNELIGTIIIYRQEVRSFTDKQIALVTGFANQVVIAMENVRLLNQLRQRTADLTESLQQQTATADVLKVISRSTFNLQAVLQVLIENATRLAGASRGFIFQFDGQHARLMFSHNAPPAYSALIEANPIPPGRGSLVGRTLMERHPVHIPDALADSEFTWHEAQRLGGFRSLLGVPMMREGNLIGVIAMWSEVVNRSLTSRSNWSQPSPTRR
jgi:two-component system, NtrC family, sensor kinase